VAPDSSDREVMEQALEALTRLRFVLDCALGMHMVRPADADGPAVQADAAIKALRDALGVKEFPDVR
jgi:hypothetical protein